VLDLNIERTDDCKSSLLNLQRKQGIIAETQGTGA
jgi:hypothetical protein